MVVTPDPPVPVLLGRLFHRQNLYLQNLKLAKSPWKTAYSPGPDLPGESPGFPPPFTLDLVEVDFQIVQTFPPFLNFAQGASRKTFYPTLIATILAWGRLLSLNNGHGLLAKALIG
ncbi:hypothetical protein SCLCIDRAFT_29721 [Scleroderma citrinum Foug A]|uniref:Uncharacterized protein n=1 Tax=Scleroderma citrinum Foug A TaxID=1036808 RepID=A0A0C2ZUT8_9AGAM|nr:hypothetical protein SCLCIDRAFT_29721 [Scleroderma citrinum Foug A]